MHSRTILGGIGMLRPIDKVERFVERGGSDRQVALWMDEPVKVHLKPPRTLYRREKALLFSCLLVVYPEAGQMDSQPSCWERGPLGPCAGGTPALPCTINQTRLWERMLIFAGSWLLIHPIAYHGILNN